MHPCVEPTESPWVTLLAGILTVGATHGGSPLVGAAATGDP